VYERKTWNKARGNNRGAQKVKRGKDMHNRNIGTVRGKIDNAKADTQKTRQKEGTVGGGRDTVK